MLALVVCTTLLWVFVVLVQKSWAQVLIGFLLNLLVLLWASLSDSGGWLVCDVASFFNTMLWRMEMKYSGEFRKYQDHLVEINQ